MMNTQGKDTRLVARVDEETQRLIAHAAELTGRSLSQFLIYAAKLREAALNHRKLAGDFKNRRNQ